MGGAKYLFTHYFKWLYIIPVEKSLNVKRCCSGWEKWHFGDWREPTSAAAWIHLCSCSGEMRPGRQSPEPLDTSEPGAAPSKLLGGRLALTMSCPFREKLKSLQVSAGRQFSWERTEIGRFRGCEWDTFFAGILPKGLLSQKQNKSQNKCEWGGTKTDYNINEYYYQLYLSNFLKKYESFNKL